MPHILSKIQIPLIKSMLRLFNSPRPSILRGGLFFCFIFLHNRHMNILQRIFTDYYEEIKYTLHHRASEMENIEKMINCGDPSFGSAMYGCPHCGNLKFIPFRYHSRFCPSCSNKYSMERTTSISFKLVNVQHRHCLIFEGGYSYDGVFVTFHYNRHEDEKYVEKTLPAMDFIKRLIRHIPEKHFKMIRYNGIYARLPAGCFQFTRTPTTVFPIKKKRLQCD